MFKTFFVSTIVCLAILMAPRFVQAETCVTQYGGAVVCGAATPEFHAPVKTGIADVNFTLLGIALLSASTLLYFKSRKSSAAAL